MSNNNLHLLIIEDEKTISDIFKSMFKTSFKKITVTSTGDEGINSIDKDDINCIISDLALPGKDGFEIIKYIRSRDMNIPFYLFSAHGSKEEMNTALQLKVTDFVIKPNLDQLIDIINTDIEHKFNTPSDKINSLTEYRKLKIKSSV